MHLRCRPFAGLDAVAPNVRTGPRQTPGRDGASPCVRRAAVAVLERHHGRLARGMAEESYAKWPWPWPWPKLQRLHLHSTSLSGYFTQKTQRREHARKGRPSPLGKLATAAQRGAFGHALPCHAMQLQRRRTPLIGFAARNDCWA
jgi:hypothetical protein